MVNIYLENVKKTFLNPPEDAFYEGRSLKAFDDFLKLLGYILPDKVTPEELIVYIKFLYKDFKEENCGFRNSAEFKFYFKRYLENGAVGGLDVLMTYFPDFIRVIADPEFSAEFLRLFNGVFFQKEEDPEQEQIEDYGCNEVSPNVIDISNKDKAEVLAALYNHSKPIGKGICDYNPAPMSVETARVLLKKMGYHYSYLKGRTMKVDLSGDLILVGLYNHDNNYPGLAQKAISTCRNITDDVARKRIPKED